MNILFIVYPFIHNVEKLNMTSIDHQYINKYKNYNSGNDYVTKTLIITDQFLNYNNGTNVSNIDVIVTE